jgi:PIN domain nuclease of toxin-antitoxin system
VTPLLLDTCAALWITRGEGVSPQATAALDEASDSGVITYVSLISAWEVGQLVARQRIQLLMTPERWFRALIAAPGMQMANLSPELLIASSFLPGTPPRDPADRIIAATARDLGATLITRDRTLLSYGGQGHLSVLAC